MRQANVSSKLVEADKKRVINHGSGQVSRQTLVFIVQSVACQVVIFTEACFLVFVHDGVKLDLAQAHFNPTVVVLEIPSRH